MLTREIVERIFSAVDAESEEDKLFNSSFVEDEKFEHFKSMAAFRVVVGNKGTGKSAFLRRYSNFVKMDDAAILLKLDPSDMIRKAGDVPSDVIKAVSHWRNFFAVEAAMSVLAKNTTEVIRLPNESLFTATSSFLGWLRGIANTVTGGAADLVLVNGRKLDDIKTITFVIDDLDRGWDGRPDGTHFVSTMLSAAFDISRRDPTIRFRISLRWDIFDAVTRTNPDVDKMRPNFTHLAWTPHQVYLIVAKRISAALGNDLDAGTAIKRKIAQNEFEIFYDPIIERRFHGRGAWSNTPTRHVLISMIRRRPRDLLSLLYQSGLEAVSRGISKIDADSLDAIFPRFSEERLNDLIVEYKSRMPQLLTLLYGFRSTGKVRRFSDVYRFTNDSLQKKIQDIYSKNPDIRFSNEASLPNFQQTVDFLYRIEFLQAFFVNGSTVTRFDFDQHQRVFVKKEDLGFSWEVLPAYRWAFQVTKANEVYDTLEAENVISD